MSLGAGVICSGAVGRVMHCYRCLSQWWGGGINLRYDNRLYEIVNRAIHVCVLYCLLGVWLFFHVYCWCVVIVNLFNVALSALQVLVFVLLEL